MVVFVVVAAFLASWLSRSEVDQRHLGTPPNLVVVNLAGPVEVVEAEGPVTVTASLSYLLLGPSIDTASGNDGAVVQASCPDWVPCRVAIRASVPPGTAVEAVAPADMVSVGAFTGPLSVVSDDGRVALGPVSGPVEVVVGSAPVRATHLQSPTARIRSVSGPVEVVATVVPEALTIEAASAPVDLTVPQARYRVGLQGDPLDAGTLGSSPRPEGRIDVASGGAVRIEVAAGRSG